MLQYLHFYCSATGVVTDIFFPKLVKNEKARDKGKTSKGKELL